MRNIAEIINLQEQWQRQWREIMGAGMDDIPAQPTDDTLLHFDIWELELDKQEECFALFPNGLRMLEQANAVIGIEPEIKAIADAELLAHLKHMNQELDIVLLKSGVQKAIDWNEPKKKCTENTVIRGGRDMRTELLMNAMPPLDPLSTILRDLFVSRYGDEGYALYEFLFEPFYRAKNDSAIAESIFWAALADEYDANPYHSVVELFKVKAQAGWKEKANKQFVFIEQ